MAIFVVSGSTPSVKVSDSGVRPLDISKNTHIGSPLLGGVTGPRIPGFDDMPGQASLYNESFAYNNNVLTDHLLNKLYIDPLRIAFGNILTKTSVVISLWNSDVTEAVTISKIVSTAGEGIYLDGLTEATVLAPNEYKLVTLVASPTGDPSVDGHITLTTSKGVFSFHVTGSRVILYSVPPQSKVTERFQWKTRIIKTLDSREQRIRLREHPIVSVKYNVYTDALCTQLSEAKIYGVGYRAIAFPVWHECVRYSGTLVAGSTRVYFDTTVSLYQADDLLMIWKSATQYETLTVSEVFPDHVTVKSPVLVSWESPLLAPVTSGIAISQVSFSKHLVGLAKHNIEYESPETVVIPEQHAFPLFEGLPVYTKLLTTRSKTVATTIKQEFEGLDFGIRAATRSKKFDTPYITKQIPMILHTQQEVLTLKKWLAFLGGMQQTFWHISNWDDFAPVGSSSPSSIVVRVKDVGFSTYYLNSTTRCCLAFRRHGETDWHLRRVTAALPEPATEDTPAAEALTLNEALGWDYNADTVAQVSLLTPVRLASDSVTIQWENLQNIICNLTVVEVKQ